MSLEHFIITVYCWVDGMIEKLYAGEKLRQRGFDPQLSDSEMITMEIVAEFIGIDTEKEPGNISAIIGESGFPSWAHVQTLQSMQLIYGMLSKGCKKN